MKKFCKKPCKHCPFRNDVKPYLHPERAAEIAYASQNPYSTFHCHKTIVEDPDSEDGDLITDNNSKLCAGFLTLRAQEGLETPEGFEPSWENVYTDTWDMITSYEEEYESKN